MAAHELATSDSPEEFCVPLGEQAFVRAPFLVVYPPEAIRLEKTEKKKHEKTEEEIM